MQAVDTNVVVRLLVQDDPEQCHQAIALWKQLLSHGGVYLSKVVVVEVVWVLQRSYQFNRQDITSVIHSLLHTDGVVVEDIEQIIAALALFSSQDADFSDYVIVESARSLDALPIHTFDKKLGCCSDARWISSLLSLA